MSYWVNCPECGRPFTVHLHRKTCDGTCCPACQAANKRSPEDVAAAIVGLVILVTFLAAAVAYVYKKAVIAFNYIYDNRSRIAQNTNAVASDATKVTSRLVTRTTATTRDLYGKRAAYMSFVKSRVQWVKDKMRGGR